MQTNATQRGPPFGLISNATQRAPSYGLFITSTTSTLTPITTTKISQLTNETPKKIDYLPIIIASSIAVIIVIIIAILIWKFSTRCIRCCRSISFLEKHMRYRSVDGVLYLDSKARKSQEKPQLEDIEAANSSKKESESATANLDSEKSEKEKTVEKPKANPNKSFKSVVADIMGNSGRDETPQKIKLTKRPEIIPLIPTYEGQIAILNTEISGMRERISKLADRISSKQTEFEQELMKKEECIQTKNNEVNNLKDQCTSLKKQLSELLSQPQLQSLPQKDLEITGLREKVSTLKNQIWSLRSEIRKTVEEKDEMEREKQGEIDQLKEQLDQMKGSLLAFRKDNHLPEEEYIIQYVEIEKRYEFHRKGVGSPQNCVQINEITNT